MPLAQRNNERGKSLALPMLGKISHFAPQALAQNGHIQRQVILVFRHDRWSERQSAVAQSIKASGCQGTETPLRSAAQAKNRGRALG